MPGYIGYRPQFNPISLQDYLAVPTMVMSEYAKAEDAYNETANKAEALKALLGERNADNEAGWQIVDKYEGLIKDAADAIAATGIQGPEGYRQAKKAGTYYRQNMLPLESGINALQTDEKELRARDKDGTLVRKRKYSLNDYIKNPNLRSDSVLGSSIQAEAMKAAAAASARKKTEPIWGKAGSNQYHSITTLTGFSPEEVQNWMLYRKTNPDKVSPELNEIYNQIATKFTDAGYDIRDIDDYITRGIYDGIAYDNKTDYQKNLNFESDADKAARIAAARKAAAGDKTAKPDGWNTAPKIYNMFVETQENLPDIKQQLSNPSTKSYDKEYSPFNNNGYLRARGSIAKSSAPSMASTAAKAAGEKLEEQIYTILDYYLAQGDKTADYNHRTLTRKDILGFVNRYEQEHDFAFGRAIANRDIDKETSTDLQQNLQGYSVWETKMNSDGTYTRGKLLKKNDDFFNEKNFTIRQLQYDQYTSTLLARGGVDKSGKTSNQDKIYEISLDRVGYLERQQIEALTNIWQDAMSQGDYGEASDILNEIMSIVDNSITLSKTKKQ